MLPEAPGRLSTTTGCPQRSASFCATRRAMMSVPPPGVNPTTIRTGLTGYEARPCPHAGVHAKASTKAARSVRISRS
jgi:hypothetical protein